MRAVLTPSEPPTPPPDPFLQRVVAFVRGWPPPRGWQVFTAVAVVFVAGVVGGIEIFRQSPAHATTSTLTFLFGGRGFLELGVSALTLLAGGFTVYYLARRSDADAKQIDLARRTLENSRLSELASRFKAGVELLGSKEDAVRVAGVYLLRDVARDGPDLYEVSVSETLASFIGTICEALVKDFKDKRGTAQTPPSYQVAVSAEAAFRTIGDVRTKRHMRRRYRIRYLVLADITFREEDFSYLTIDVLVAQTASFIECKMTSLSATIFLHDGEDVPFSDPIEVSSSDLIASRMWIHGAGDESETFSRASFRDCDLRNASLHAHDKGVFVLRRNCIDEVRCFEESVDFSRCFILKTPPDYWHGFESGMIKRKLLPFYFAVGTMAGYNPYDLPLYDPPPPDLANKDDEGDLPSRLAPPDDDDIPF